MRRVLWIPRGGVMKCDELHEPGWHEGGHHLAHLPYKDGDVQGSGVGVIFLR